MFASVSLQIVVAIYLNGLCQQELERPSFEGSHQKSVYQKRRFIQFPFSFSLTKETVHCSVLPRLQLSFSKLLKSESLAQ